MMKNDFIKKHVACIVLQGNSAVKAKQSDFDKGHLFGMSINWGADEKTWKKDIKELQKLFSSENAKIKNLEGIKLIIDDHGNEHGYYCGKIAKKYQPEEIKFRFKQVCDIIKTCLENKQNAKIYFENWACHGANFFMPKNLKSGRSKNIEDSIYSILKNNLGDDLSRRTYCAQSIPGMGETIVDNERVPYYRHVKKWTTREPWAFYPSFYVKGFLTRLCSCNKKPTWNELALRNAKKDNSKNYGLNLGCDSKIYFPLYEYNTINLDSASYCVLPNELNKQKKSFLGWCGKEAQQKKNNFLKWGKEKKSINNKNSSINDQINDQTTINILNEY